MLTHTLLLLPALLVLSHIKAASVPVVLPDGSDVAPANDPGRGISCGSAINKFGFAIIRNSTIPCNSNHQQEAGKYRYHRLSNEDKMAILEMEGGSFVKEYMATDETSARETFPSLLDMDFKFRKRHPKWVLTKAAMKHLLDKEAEEASEKGVQGAHSVHQNNTKMGRKKDRENVFVRPKDMGLDDVITDKHTGDISRLEFCLTRGTRTSDNTYLYMCTTCSVTTNLGDTYWPAIFNEARCIQADPYCFITQDTLHHGVCQQGTIPMWMLKKLDGFCSLGLKDGETVLVDKWLAIEREVQIGCTCVINAMSEFAEYVGRF